MIGSLLFSMLFGVVLLSAVVAMSWLMSSCVKRVASSWLRCEESGAVKRDVALQVFEMDGLGVEQFCNFVPVVFSWKIGLVVEFAFARGGVSDKDDFSASGLDFVDAWF